MKELIIHGGYVVTLDDEDYERISAFNWFYDRGKAVREIWKNNKYVAREWMHRTGTNAPEKSYIFHIDKNRLNNQKGNLIIKIHGSRKEKINEKRRNKKVKPNKHVRNKKRINGIRNECVFHEDHVEILLIHANGNSRKALIDLDDFNRISRIPVRWSAQWSPTSMSHYVIASIGKTNERKRIFIHREIMNPPSNMVVDHINHDTLDNRKQNLRVVTYGENTLNRKNKLKTHA